MICTGRRWIPRQRRQLQNRPPGPSAPPPGPGKTERTGSGIPGHPELQPQGGQERDPRWQLHEVSTLLDHGFSAADITELSGLPQALVELIAQRQHQQGSSAQLDAAQRSDTRTSSSKTRRVRRVAHAVIVLSTVNICLIVAALIWHLPTLAAWGTGGALTLIASTLLLARYVSPPPPRRPVRRPR